MIVKLLIEHHLEFLSLKGGCRGSSVYTQTKITKSQNATLLESHGSTKLSKEKELCQARYFHLSLDYFTFLLDLLILSSETDFYADIFAWLLNLEERNWYKC